MINEIHALIQESVAVNQALLGDAAVIEQIAHEIAQAFKSGHKVLLLGNGGSAADAQHVAAELVGRLAARERPAWPALALTTNTSILTAVSNDYGFDHVFERQVQAFAASGDVVVGISTSGNSKNVIVAVQAARQRGCRTIAFTGQSGGRLKSEADCCLSVASDSTPRIQEAHILAWHIICELVEREMTGQP